MNDVHHLSDLWTKHLRWLSKQPGVTEVSEVEGDPGVYYAGFLLDGVPVSLSAGYTE